MQPLNQKDISDGHYYTLEFRVSKLSRTQLDQIMALLQDNNPQYKEFSKLPIKPEQKTSI